MSRFTDLFQEMSATPEPAPEPQRVEEEVSKNVIPVAKTLKKKKSKIK